MSQTRDATRSPSVEYDGQLHDFRQNWQTPALCERNPDAFASCYSFGRKGARTHCTKIRSNYRIQIGKNQELLPEKQQEDIVALGNMNLGQVFRSTRQEWMAYWTQTWCWIQKWHSIRRIAWYNTTLLYAQGIQLLQNERKIYLSVTLSLASWHWFVLHSRGCVFSCHYSCWAIRNFTYKEVFSGWMTGSQFVKLQWLTSTEREGGWLQFSLAECISTRQDIRCTCRLGVWLDGHGQKALLFCAHFLPSGEDDGAAATERKDPVQDILHKLLITFGSVHSIGLAMCG